jgi:hypothetical protein
MCQTGGRSEDFVLSSERPRVYKTRLNENEKEAYPMALQLGDVAPDFEADTTEGRIKFHDYIDGSWAVLVSHPRTSPPSARRSSARWRR